jgi:hypothetical protein
VPRSRFDGGLLVLVGLLGVLVAALLSHDNRISADGIDHYVYLRSLWVDHDLDLGNDYDAVTRGRAAVADKTPLGRTANPHPIGPALVWVPFYAVADGIARWRGEPADGLGPVYRDAVSLASLLYGWLGLVLLYRTARRVAGAAAALLATLGMALGTFLYWYLVQDPTMAHAAAFGAAALVVWLWLRPSPTGLARAVALGGACGLAAILRWQAALLFVLVAAEAVERLSKRERPIVVLRDLAVAAASAVVVFTPQLVVFKLLYGSWLTIPQGSAFLAGAPAWSGVLFSPRHGLFSWSPFLYVAVAGLVLWLRRSPAKALAAVVVFLLCARLNAGVADWWGGSSFGGRRFDIALPLLGVATALFFQWIASVVARRPALALGGIVATFALWNALLVSSFRSGAWDYSGPVTFEEMGRGASGVIDRSIGSPFSLPGALWERIRRGRALTDYESLFTERPFSRWSVRFGIDERIFLEDGWSEAREADGVLYRSVEGESAGFIVPLHRSVSYRLGIRARARAGTTTAVRIIVNQRPAGVVQIEPSWGDHEISVSASFLRPGRNFVRLRILGDAGAGAIDVSGAWMTPESEAGERRR